MTLFHGGQFGLCPGQMLLPPCESGATNTLLAQAVKAGLSTPARADAVYVTSSFDAALMYAALHPSGGAVYVVRAIGELRADPDCDQPGLSFECERAVIIHAHPVTCSERQLITGMMVCE
jgi:hypothetical protein